MSVALRHALRMNLPYTLAASRPALVANSSLRAARVPGLRVNTPRRHASAATSPLVPKQYLRVPLPDNCQVLQLRDGRLMSYAEYGSKAPDAHPFIFIHGIPDCRLNSCLLQSDHALAEKLNIRWIAIDRPGMGLSTIQPGRDVVGWVDDLQQLIRHLQLEAYRILSVSGGTGYALASARTLPREQLRSLGIMVGVGPWEAGMAGVSMVNRACFYVYKYWPGFFRFIQSRYMLPALQQESPQAVEEMFRKQLKYFKNRDQKAFEPEEEQKAVTTLLRETYRQGLDGPLADIKVATDYWGFDVKDVDYPGIRLWYGLEDMNTPPEMGRYMAARLPKAICKEYKGKRHLSMWDHVEEVLRDMLQDT